MIIFLIFLIIILIFLNKKIIINADVSVINFEYNFCIRIKYFFDLITIYKEDLIKYRKKTIRNNKKQKQDYKWILKRINIDKINFELRFGLGDPVVTSLLVPVVSTILAIGLERYLSKSSKRFLVNPIYNKFAFNFKGTIYISIKLKDLIYIIFKILKERKNKVK